MKVLFDLILDTDTENIRFDKILYEWDNIALPRVDELIEAKIFNKIIPFDLILRSKYLQVWSVRWVLDQDKITPRIKVSDFHIGK